MMKFTFEKDFLFFRSGKFRSKRLCMLRWPIDDESFSCFSAGRLGMEGSRTFYGVGVYKAEPARPPDSLLIRQLEQRLRSEKLRFKTREFRCERTLTN